MRSDAHSWVRPTSSVRVGAGLGWAFALCVSIRPLDAAFAAGGGDYDGDTVSDSDEDLNGDGDPTNDDSDGDGTPDGLDDDDDGDGVPTIDEDVDGDGDPTNDFTDPLNEEEPDYLNDNTPTDRDHDDHVSVEYGGDDCDDTRLGIHPDVDHDPLYDGEDWNCDGNEFEFDGDRDGYDSSVELAGGDDCNDYDPEIHPGAVEGSEPIGVDVDMDCDGWTDSVGTLVPNGGCDCDSSGPGAGLLTALLALGATRRRRRA
jgi:large repetitive protein